MNVEQDDRSTAAAMTHAQGDRPDLDEVERKSVEHPADAISDG